MKNKVMVWFDGYKSVEVDGKDLQIANLSISTIQDKLPNNLEPSKIVGFDWNITRENKIVFAFNDGGVTIFDADRYDDLVQPYVDIWQAEKDRLEQEQQQAQEEYLKFENRKERALNTIQADYDSVLDRGFVRTSLGFDADITPDSVATLLGTQLNLAYTARTLGKEAEVPKTVFRDFYGLKRELDAVQVERLVCEINGAQNYIRELKYEFKGQVKETYDNDSLNAVIEKCVYSTLDYSNLDEQGQPTVLPFVETKSIKDRIDRW